MNNQKSFLNILKFNILNMRIKKNRKKIYDKGIFEVCFPETISLNLV